MGAGMNALKKTKRHFKQALRTVVLTAIVSSLTVWPSFAEISSKDWKTMLRTMGFLEGVTLSGSKIAIIYNPQSESSKSEADQMQSYIKKENPEMQVSLVTASNLDNVHGAKFAFVTQGLQSNYSSIRSKLSSQKIVSFTNDRSCVTENACTVFINSSGKVEIVINKKSSDEAGAVFKPVFLMMVTVI